jgi:hypothetical protein
MDITFAASVHASDSMSTVWTKKFSDKPSYQRQKEILNSADLTQFEVATEVVKTTNFGGRPPFHRIVNVLRLVDANRLELVQEIRFIPAPRRGEN